MKKSIIIPCYNEVNNIAKVIDKVLSKIESEDNIIIVDDGSSDGTAQYLANIKNEKIKVILNSQNFGKGFALRTAFKEKEHFKDLVLIQDADLEYSPDDYEKLLLPFIETNADVVYGSRFLGGSKYQRIHFFWHFLANKILTFITNIFTNLNMTDMETGYKVFKKSALVDLNLKENSFGIEPEITIKLAKKKLKFYEVPVSYAGRSYEEGKKIRLKDAFIALYCIIKYSFTN